MPLAQPVPKERSFDEYYEAARQAALRDPLAAVPLFWGERDPVAGLGDPIDCQWYYRDREQDERNRTRVVNLQWRWR